MKALFFEWGHEWYETQIDCNVVVFKLVDSQQVIREAHAEWALSAVLQETNEKI